MYQEKNITDKGGWLLDSQVFRIFYAKNKKLNKFSKQIGHTK